MQLSDYLGNRRIIKLNKKIRLFESACVGGSKENDGPLGKYLDEYYSDALVGEKSFEIAESRLCERSLRFALDKAKIPDTSIDILLAGDLLNQCTGAGYGLSMFDIPYIGLYGACSTCAEGLMLASLMIESGTVTTAAVVASSHFCSAERQFRYPLGYGSFSGPTAQSTVTGAGAFLLCDEEKINIPESNAKAVYIDEVLPGIVADRGIKDAGNMGAAMCSAACDTLDRYIDSGEVSELDGIYTGDLGWEGTKLLSTLLGEKAVPINDKLYDCGLLIYDIKTQKVGCGGSGCGCSAVVTAGYLMNELRNGNMNKVALVGTGAMMSPKSLKQGLSIPAIAHLVTLKSN